MELEELGKTFEEIEKEFDGQGYGIFKPAVGEAVVELLRPIQEEAQKMGMSYGKYMAMNYKRESEAICR